MRFVTNSCVLACGGLFSVLYVRFGIRWLVFKEGVIIPLIVAVAGITGVVGTLVCALGNHYLFVIGIWLLIGGYWTYQPITSMIISVCLN